ncbi:MAG: hypothetical protein JO251_08140 [Verrucomicrobia bacterium]|nr:hypothetical protein [Verrucomicrobiota bacterium]
MSSPLRYGEVPGGLRSVVADTAEELRFTQYFSQNFLPSRRLCGGCYDGA